MSATNRSGFLALMVVLATLTAPAAQATPSPTIQQQNSESIDFRLRRISEALRGLEHQPVPPGDTKIAFGFLNGPGMGWGNAPIYGGFGNAQPYYGAGGGFLNGGGFGNYRPAWGNGGFVNGWRGGFRNW